MKTITNFFLTIAFCFSAQSAFACAGAGLKKEQIMELMNQVELTLKTSENLKDSSIASVVWTDIKTRAGAEGDCDAAGLNAKVNVMAKNAAGDYCQFAGPVEIFKSETLGSTNSLKLEKGSYCRW